MRGYKRIVACLLVISILSTNSLTTFAQVIGDIRNENTIEKAKKEVFTYPKANVYTKEEENKDNTSQNKEAEETKEEQINNTEQKDEDKKEDEQLATQPVNPKESAPTENTTEETKAEDNKTEEKEPTKEEETKQEETKQEETKQEEIKQEETKQEDDIKKDEKELNNPEKEKEELNYPTLDEEEDEFDALYGAPIEITKYTKVYKTAEGTYKTVYSDIPNTFLDEDGQEKEIDNTLTPVVEEKEVEVKEEGKTEEIKEDTKEDTIENAKEDTIEDKKDVNNNEKRKEETSDSILLNESKSLKAQTTTKLEDETKNLLTNDTGVKTEPSSNEETQTTTKTKEVVTAYTNVSNNMEVTLPAEGSEKNGISLRKDDFAITLYPTEGDYSKAAVKENAVLYNQVYENIDVQYTVDTFGIKEDIILKEKTKKNEYTYQIAKEGLSAKLIDNVVYLFKGEENIPSMVLSAPLMKDEAGEESRDIILTLKEDDSNYIITLKPDETWLNSEDRVYPVHIDPSVDTIDKDIVIYSICSNSDFLSSTTGYVGYFDEYGKTRSYVIIGYAFTGMLPDNAVITDAKLHLYQYAGNEKGNITCYRLEKALPHAGGIDGMTWSKTVSINREVAGENSSFKTKKGKHEIDIRDTVSRWVEGIAPVHGLTLIADNETKTSAEFYTYESSGVSKSKKPKIVIDWKYEGELDENAYTLDETTINLRTLIEANINGKHFFHGVYADGLAKPGATVQYELNDASKNFNASVLAGFYKVFPNSSATNSLFPSATTKYKDKLSNWQTTLPFVDYEYNVLYQISATASKDGIAGKKADSESFLIYKVTQFDTLPKIAKYYGVPLNEMLFDNKAADMLVVKNNTLFIRNPKKNANKPYNPPKLKDDAKAQIDSLLMGRGLHCEFGFEPINLNTGNFYMEQTDASFIDEAKDFSITRNYNSKGAEKNSLFGRGWKSDYEEQIAMDENFNVIYSRGDGSSMVFTKNGEAYNAPSGYDYTLQRNVIGTRTVMMGTKEKSYSVYEYAITDHTNTKRVFNEYGYLTKITDKKGNVTTITYDENYFLRQIISSTGMTYTVDCNDNGNITGVTLPNGQKLAYGYDDKENLVSFTNEIGITLQYAYDDNHRMVAWYDGNGSRVIHNTYDAEDRVIKQIDANGKESTLSYEGGRTVTTDGNGATTFYSYDDQYRTTRIDYPNGTAISKNYQNNQLVSETDALGHTTSYAYDANGNITRTTRFDGATKTNTYNAQNMVTSETDYEGREAIYEYDDRSNLLKAILPENRVITYQYDGNNHLTQMTDAKGNPTTFTYQGTKIHTITDAIGQTSTLSYNDRGDITAITDPKGNVTSYEYDGAGRKIKQTNGAGYSTLYTYDNAGNITSITDQNGGRNTLTHDGNGNILSLTDPLGGVYTYEYDALGNNTRLTDPKGIVTSYSYDSMGNNTSVSNQEGQTISYEYDAFGNVIKETQPNDNATLYTYDYRTNQVDSVTDSLGATASLAYSSTGLLLKQSDANGNQTNYSYDTAGRLKQQTNPNGLSITYTYDQNNNVTQVLYSDGRKYTYVYDKRNLLVAVALPNDATLQYTYDVLGNLEKSTDALGYESTYEHDALGNLTAKMDANGNKTSYAFDGNNNLLQVKDPLGNTQKNVFDPLNQVTKMVDENNYVTQYAYDAGGNITAITDALNGVTNYEYDDRNLVTKVTDANGNSYTLEYDNNANHTKMTSPNGVAVSYTYDSRNLLVKQKDTEGLETTYEYDQIGQLTKEETNAGEITKYTYDAMGNVSSITNSLMQTTKYTYDVSGNLIKVEGYDGNQTTYEYDKMGNVISITDPEGKVTHYVYDKNNQLVSKEDDAMRLYQYTYDKLGNLISDINPLGEKNTYEYDALGNLLSIQDAAGKVQSFAYDKTGNIIADTDKNGNQTKYTYDALSRVIEVIKADSSKEQYLYDALGNLIKYQDALSYVTNYTYDSQGQLNQLTTPNGGVYQYTYDGHGNNTSIINPLGAVTTMEYDKKGQMIKRSLPNTAEYSYEYDAIGRLTKIQAPQQLSKQYSYDAAGDLVKEQDQAGREITYAYDKQHRLLSATNEEKATTSYNYDERGNLSSVVTPLGGKQLYSYDVLDRITSMTDPVGKITQLNYDIQGNLTKITENGGRVTQYGYDAMGNQTFATNALNQTTKYEYDSNNQIIGIIDAANQKTSYTYDKVGQLTSATNAKGKSVQLTYDGNGNVTEQKDQEGRSITYTYDLADQLIKVTDADQIETNYTYDVMGNLTGITDANQNTTSYTYDLLGRMTSITNPLSEVQEFVYDVEGRLKETKQADGSKISYDYNKLDQLVSVDYGEEHKQQNILYAYDAKGQRISMEDVSGTTAYAYDEAGRIISVKTSDEKEIQYSYDSYGNLSELMYPDGKKVTYTYDALDRLTILTDRNNNKTLYTYDERGNLTQIKRPNHTITKLEFDVLNQVSSVENLDEDGNKLSAYYYTYDNSGFITKEEERRYEGKEKKKTQSIFSYDLRGQLSKVVKVEDGKESEIRYTYDKAGNRICMERSEDTAKKQIIENQYNEANRLIASKDSINGETKYEYDKNGNMVKELAPGEEVVEYYYDIENRLSSVKEQGTLLMAALYDGDGNRIFTVEKTKQSYEETIAPHNDFIQGEQSKQKPVEWDTYNRKTTWDQVLETIKKTLIRTDIQTTRTKTTKTEITTMKETTTTTKGDETQKDYAPMTQVEESKQYVDPAKHFFWYGFSQGLVQGFSGAPQYLSGWLNHAWDYIANQQYLNEQNKLAKQDTSLSADNQSTQTKREITKKIEEDKKTEVIQNETSYDKKTEVEYGVTGMESEVEDFIPDDEPEGLSGYEKVLYDTVLIPSGAKDIERTNYQMTSYVNDVNQEHTQVLMEYDVENQVASVYDYGIQRNSYTNQRENANQTQYYLYDGRGSVSSLTSIKGNPLVSYQYDAYGSATVKGQTYSPYQYNAEAVDHTTGLQYLRARYYNSNIGGFITQDTYLGTLEEPITQNLYTYTGNNPLNAIDPSGHSFKSKAEDLINSAKEGAQKALDWVTDTWNDLTGGGKKDSGSTPRGSKDIATITSKTSNNFTSPGKTTTKGNNNNESNPFYHGPRNTTQSNDAFADYLANQVENQAPKDPVRASLESRFGGANITNVTNSHAYVNGVFVTAMSYRDFLMCTTADKATTQQAPKVDTIAKCFGEIGGFLRGFAEGALNTVSPFQVDFSTGKNQEQYDVGNKTGEVFGILSLLYGMMGGGMSNSGSPTVVGVSGNGTAVAGNGGIGGVYAIPGFSDMENSIKKQQEEVRKSESKKESGNKGYEESKGGKGSSNLKNENSIRIQRLIDKSTPGRSTKGKSKQFEKNGDYNQALKDFNSLKPTEIYKDGNTTIGKLSDGRSVNIRPNSTEGSVTLDIFNPSNGTHIKFRYKE